MSDNPCPHLNEGGVCAIATQLAEGREVRPKEDACHVCSTCFVPRDVNHVTASLSLSVYNRDDNVRERLRASHAKLDLFNLGRREITEDPASLCWPGCQLAILIKDLAGVSRSDGCGCGSLANEMDTMGVDWCRKNVDSIVDNLVANLNEWISAQDAKPPEGQEGEPQFERDRLPWWIKYGHRIPGASKLAGRIIVNKAIDQAEVEIREQAKKDNPLNGSLSG